MHRNSDASNSRRDAGRMIRRAAGPSVALLPALIAAGGCTSSLSSGRVQIEPTASHVRDGVTPAWPGPTAIAAGVAVGIAPEWRSVWE